MRATGKEHSVRMRQTGKFRPVDVVDLARVSFQGDTLARLSLRVLLMIGISMAFGCSSESTTLNEMRQIESRLPVGLSRQEAYSRLRAHGLVARNADFAHWRLQGHAAIPLDHGDWPTAGQTYPPNPDELYLHMSAHRVSPANPPVEVLLGGRFYFGCGFAAWLDI